jgi:hypothetical protein
MVAGMFGGKDVMALPGADAGGDDAKLMNLAAKAGMSVTDYQDMLDASGTPTLSKFEQKLASGQVIQNKSGNSYGYGEQAGQVHEGFYGLLPVDPSFFYPGTNTSALIGPTTGALLFDDLKKHDGGGIDERVVIAQVGEFMMQRRAAQHYGPHVMHAINTMQIPLEHLRYHAGGEIDDMGALLDTSFYSSSDSSKSGGVRRLEPREIVIESLHLHVDDFNSAFHKFLADPAGRKAIASTARKN